MSDPLKFSSPPNDPVSPHVPPFSTDFVLVDFLKDFGPLGLVAFGGPTAHIALLRDRFVKHRKVLDEETFVELFGLCSAMPGPTSTQLVVALAALRGGVWGGLLAYAMWSIPGFLILSVAGVTSGLYYSSDPEGGIPDWMAGLAPAATAMVFVATWQLSKSVMDSKLKIALALFAACVTLVVMGDSRVDPRVGSASFPLVLLFGGLVTLADSHRKDRLAFYFKPPSDETERLAEKQDAKGIRKRLRINRTFGCVLILLWIAGLATVITLRAAGYMDNLGVLFEGMYRIGSIIYGGGQVVLPMLEQEKYASRAQFFQGFALVQALPGPLFNFSAFLGGVFSGVPGAFVGVIGINTPGLLLTFGVLPFWASLRRIPWFRVFITGVSASSIGLLFTACIQLWEAGVFNPSQAVVFLISGAMTAFFNVPVPFSILFGGILGFALSPSAIGIGQSPYCPATFVNITA